MMKLFVLFAIVGASYLSAAPKLPPTVYDVTPLMSDGAGSITLMAGKQLQLKAAAKAGAKVLFEDLLPGANWKHAARYKVVAKNGQVLETVDAQFPPRELDQAKVVSGVDVRGQNVEFNINDFRGEHKIANPEKYFALLIEGSADQRHWNDFSFLYRVLTKMYGYDPENIFVADSVFKDRKPDLGGTGRKDIQFESTRAGIEAAITALKGKITKDDHLLLAVNDHGGTEGGESTIVLYDGQIKVSDFMKLVNDVPAAKVLSIYEQCFSGGFVRPSVGYNKVAMAASTDKESSWASTDLNFDEFIYHVIAAFGRQTHEGKAIDVTLKDGKVSAQEAFAYAIRKDAAAESPILEAQSNSGNTPQIGVAY